MRWAIVLGALALPWAAPQASADAVYPNNLSASYKSYTSPTNNTVEFCFTQPRSDAAAVGFNYCVAKDNLPSNWNNREALSTRVMCAKTPNYGRNYPGTLLDLKYHQVRKHCMTKTNKGRIPALRPQRYIFSVTSFAWPDGGQQQNTHHDRGAHTTHKLVELEAPNSQ